MKHFVYSDPHFGHANVIQYSNRPFPNIDEMNRELIRRFNQVVGKADKVYILGDFGMGSQEKIAEIIGKLHGYKVLIMGNHDRSKSRNWWLDAGFDEVHKDPILIHKQFLLSHRPLDIPENSPFFNIHGHLHTLTVDSLVHLNVSVEQTDYVPVPVSKLNSRIHEKNILIRQQRKAAAKLLANP